ncbi:MAG: DUF2791 family P-loop domain-containing protein [Deltaproteobacteria bacterium]|nr:DUF2791 family P-loop domain-containing protein [Deltaproteobacteria bacterium]MBW2011571.1 DUF2791 family P-loop domain-containing protein [Deltaproteobacteria bacterium]MBW2100329.1 DUF2791 family P-loop domain-containing protein [Deltaproteobacteria bacterium]
MDTSVFLQALERVSAFQLRRVVERLRDGLFDPLGVQLLTAHEAHLNRAFDQVGNALGDNSPAHLCICGAYGQGKSHSLTYLRQRALEQGFVTSLINLDPREIPFYNFRQVYQALVAEIRFPGMEKTSLVNQWKAWAKEQKAQNPNFDVLDLLPDEMPHLFKAVLAALARENVRLSKREKALKKHASFRPREFPYLLARALGGEAIPVYRLRHAFKYREVSFYKDASLTCRGTDPYVRMVYGLARLFQQMGFKGWVLLFDEGESIVQTRITSRSKSYQILNKMFVPDSPAFGFYPVFAFTDDFFMKVQEEDYEQVRIRNEVEFRYFDQNYAESWRDLTVYRLHDLTLKEWKDLSEKLIVLHSRAYGWRPPEIRTREEMADRLSKTHHQEARLKLKALVDQLDLIHQEQVLKS